LRHEFKEHGRAAEALSQSEERYRLLVESATEGIMVSQDRVAKFFNAKALEISGYSAEEFASKPTTEHVHPEDQQEIIDNYFRRLKGEEAPASYTFRIVAKQGQVKWLYANTVVIDWEGRPAALLCLTDFTELKRTEEALRIRLRLMSFAQTHSLADLLRQALDEVCTLTDSSIGFYGSVEADPETITMQAWSTRTIEEFCTAQAKGMQINLDQAGVWADCVRQRGPVVHNDYFSLPHCKEMPPGHAEVLRELVVPVLRSDRIVAILGVGNKPQDYTESDVALTNHLADVAYAIVESKLAEEEKALLEAQYLQAQKMEAIGTLAGGIAHDFNNILSAVLGYTELALNSSSLQDKEREYLEQVLAAGGRARDMVSQISAFSRQSPGEHKVIQIAPLVKEALKLLRASIPNTIEVSQDIHPDAGKIMGDPTHIYQVLMNLCTNASHAMRDSCGVLNVTLQAETLGSQGTPTIEGLNPGPYLCLTVSDTGQGMTPEVQQRIFEPFFTTKGVGEGTGLGLSVVHGIIKNHGGAITVQGQPGQGSTFKIYLPRVEGEVGSILLDHAPLPHGQGRILFVDDEEPLAKLGKNMLERQGYSVHTYSSSLEALAAFRFQPHTFDLAIIDKSMPQMTGLQLAGEIRAIRPDLPIFLCSGDNEPLPPETMRSLGIRKLILKPTSSRAMAEALRDVLGQSGAQATTREDTPKIMELASSSEADPATVVQLLNELSSLLDSDMAEAMQRLDNLGDVMKASDHAPAFRQVDKLVREFDMDAARQSIAALIQMIQEDQPKVGGPSHDQAS